MTTTPIENQNNQAPKVTQFCTKSGEPKGYEVRDANGNVTAAASFGHYQQKQSKQATITQSDEA